MSVKITLDQYEVMMALGAYMEREYGISADLNDPLDWPTFTYSTYEYPWKKHKNGRFVKDPDGHKQKDWDKQTVTSHTVEWTEMDDLTVYLRGTA